MKVEHIGYNVKDPIGTAKWYVVNLGMRVVRKRGEPMHAHFLADKSGCVLLEIYNNPKVVVPDYASMNPAVLHLAFSVDDVRANWERLRSAGAKSEGEIALTDEGDELAMLRDPWGFPIQLVKRGEPMV